MILYNYSDKEIKELLKSLIVLIDTREQINNHITSYFESKKIPFKHKKLHHGDYTCMIPSNPELGISRDLYFNNLISIERKRDLNELSNNFTHDRARFESEFLRAKGKIILLVENSSYENLVHGRYITKYDPKSFIASLKAFESRYNISTQFILDDSYTGNYIYYSLYYFVREYLKGTQLIA